MTVYDDMLRIAAVQTEGPEDWDNHLPHVRGLLLLHIQ